MNLLNKSSVKRHFLQRAEVLRPAWAPTRFSEENYNKLEAELRAWIDQKIMQQPSIGKTIKL